MKHSRIIILILICVKFSSLFSQYTVSGIVKDTLEAPMSFASVLMYADDSLVTGCITNNDGTFRIENIVKGEYGLEISFTGYASYQGECNVISNVDLGIIILKENPEVLDEVTIYGEKTSTSTMVDRLIYEISPADIKNATNSYHVLKNVPELNVNTIDRKVSVTGAENTLVLINNIKRDPKAILSIDPKDIVKVEVITNPSARFLSRDVTAVINIITKEKTSGYTGEISESITPDIKTDNWTEYTFRYKKNKIGFYSYGYFSYLNEDKTQQNITSKTYANGTEVLKEKKTDLYTYGMNSADITSGIEINFNEKNFMLLDAHIGGWKSNTKKRYNGIYSINEIEQHEFKIENPGESYEYKQKYTVYYQSKLDTMGKLLAIEANHNIFTDSYTSYYSEISPADTFINNLHSESIKKSYDLQADYSQNFGNTKGEAGYRVYYQDVRQDLTYISENNLLEMLEYTELRNYFYSNFNGSFFDKFSYQTGIGAEFTNTYISNLRSDTVDYNYFKFLPAFGLQYKINKKQSLKFNYVTRLYRPAISALNPSKRYTDSLIIKTGNPYLVPYYNHRFEIKYSYSYEKLYISPLVKYIYIPGYIVQVGKTGTDGVYVTTYNNQAKYEHFIPAVNINYKITKDWKVKAYIYYQYTKYKDTIHNILSDLGSFGYSVSTSYDFNDLSFYLSYDRSPEYLFGEGSGRSADDSWLSILYYLNDNWNIGFDIRYFKLWKEYSTIDKPYYYEYFEHWTKDRQFRFYINIIYSFEKGKEVHKKRKKIQNKDSGAGLKL